MKTPDKSIATEYEIERSDRGGVAVVILSVTTGFFALLSLILFIKLVLIQNAPQSFDASSPGAVANLQVEQKKTPKVDIKASPPLTDMPIGVENQRPSPPSEASQSPPEFVAGDPWKVYFDNPAQGEATYKGKWAEVSVVSYSHCTLDGPWFTI
jgi:hypothetical protein